MPPVAAAALTPWQPPTPWVKVSLLFALQVTVLAVTLILGQALSRKRCQWLGEAGVALLLGAAIGAALVATHSQGTFTAFTHFNKEFFFLAVLPPIIFEAGLSMDVEGFFRNIGAPRRRQHCLDAPTHPSRCRAAGWAAASGSDRRAAPH